MFITASSSDAADAQVAIEDVASEISENLVRLYDYMIRQLALAQVRKETHLLAEVRILLEELREGWRGVIEKLSETQEAVAGSKNAQPVARPKSFKIPEKALEGMPPTLNIAG